MQLAIQVCTYLIGLPLELLAIAALLRGHYKRYPFIFVYAIADFITTTFEMPFNLQYMWTGNQHNLDSLVTYYWIDELVLQVLIYSVVISLLYDSTVNLPSRRIVRLCLVGGAVLFAVVTFAINYNPHTPRIGEWMTPWSRDLNFCSAILDLALWALLIASREKDHRLLMVSGALGIQFTGEAIGGSLRHLAQSSHSHLTANVGDAVVILTNLIFLYILWQTFRKAPAGEPLHS